MRARLSFARPVSSGGGTFLAALPGFPCLELDIERDGPCFASEPVRVELNAVPLPEAFLGRTLDPE